ncbi:MAG: type II secretion system F family protein, partial [Candidatus Cloacimonetes bacterium]|nr:type II secretion system F family protein [Candidatus Cloacimonadota bacterium]
MQTFQYTAIDNIGNSASGKLTVTSKEQAVNILREKGLMITNISEVKEFQPLKILKSLRGPPTMEKVVFTRQFATMVSSGLPITQALKILEAQSKDEGMKEALRDIITDIDGGSNLHDAFSHHPSIFSRLYLALVRAGEASGNLDEILNRLADSMQQDSEFKGKIKSAMIYPALIVILMVGVLILMMVFVIPKLTTVYEEFGVELPITTKMIIAGSNTLMHFWWAILILVAFLVFLYRG